MSGTKFNRAFVMRVQPNTLPKRFIEIKSPFTCEFVITRHNLASANTATFTIYNLGENNRRTIVKDPWDIDDKNLVEFYAGYHYKPTDMLPLCFRGSIQQAYSYREGPDFRTVIEAYDGAITFVIKEKSYAYSAQAPTNLIIKDMAKDLTGNGSVTVGNKFQSYLQRSQAFIGNPFDLLQEVTDTHFYIDSSNAYALAVDEAIKGTVTKLDADSGLLSTPRISDTLIEVETLFEPQIIPSQNIEIVSKTNSRFTGFYKVTGFSHRGTISDAIGGELRTTITMMRIPNISGINNIQDYHKYTAEV